MPKKSRDWRGFLVGAILLYAIGMGYFQTVVNWFFNNMFLSMVLIMLILIAYGYLSGKFKDWFGR